MFAKAFHKYLITLLHYRLLVTVYIYIYYLLYYFYSGLFSFYEKLILSSLGCTDVLTAFTVSYCFDFSVENALFNTFYSFKHPIISYFSAVRSMVGLQDPLG